MYSQYYDNFKTIRNQLRKYYTKDVFDFCMNQLRIIWGKELITFANENLSVPWKIFLIMKWALIYSETYNYQVKTFKDKDFFKLYQEMDEIVESVSFLNNTELGIWKCIRSIAVQQYYFHSSNSIYGLCVQEIILKDIGIDYDVDNNLRKITGVSLDEFIDFQFICLAQITKNGFKWFSLETFYKLFKKYNKNNFQKYLNYISLNFNDLREYFIADHKKINNIEYEKTLLSPLYRKPLFRDNNRYHPYNISLLHRFNDFALYEILKSDDSDMFSGKFGYGFEKYIKNSLETFNIKYFDDEYIKSILGKKKTNPDILIKEKYNNIILEVKSGEMYNLTLINPSQDTFIKSLENSIIKGYKQIIKTSYLLNKKTKKTSQFFGMIITYKNLLLGSPETIWNEFMKEIITNEIPEEYKDSPIEYNNIFCISLEEFEMLLLYLKRENISLSDFLRKASKEDKKLFFMHLDYDNINLSELYHIQNKRQEMLSRVKRSLERN